MNALADWTYTDERMAGNEGWRLTISEEPVIKKVRRPEDGNATMLLDDLDAERHVWVQAGEGNALAGRALNFLRDANREWFDSYAGGMEQNDRIEAWLAFRRGQLAEPPAMEPGDYCLAEVVQMLAGLRCLLGGPASLEEQGWPHSGAGG